MSLQFFDSVADNALAPATHNSLLVLIFNRFKDLIFFVSDDFTVSLKKHQENSVLTTTGSAPAQISGSPLLRRIPVVSCGTPPHAPTIDAYEKATRLWVAFLVSLILLSCSPSA